MSHLTSVEAKQLAAYLRASCSLVSESPKHGQWLNAISHSCGFRDWNAMVGSVPDVPETTWGEWCDVFFGVARVEIAGQGTSDHIVWSRNRDPSRHEIAVSLAQSVLGRARRAFRGVSFQYSQPDTPEPVPKVATLNLARRWSKSPWFASAPIIATSADMDIKVLLWWLRESYTMAEYYPERERRFSYHSLIFDGYGYEASLTDDFMTQLTGKARAKRTCLYVPEFPNGPEDSFIPVVVQEGCRDAELTSLNFGTDRDKALARTSSFNREKGTTSADMEAISRQFRMYEPQEELFDDFSYFAD